MNDPVLELIDFNSHRSVTSILAEKAEAHYRSVLDDCNRLRERVVELEAALIQFRRGDPRMEETQLWQQVMGEKVMSDQVQNMEKKHTCKTCYWLVIGQGDLRACSHKHSFAFCAPFSDKRKWHKFYCSYWAPNQCRSKRQQEEAMQWLRNHLK